MACAVAAEYGPICQWYRDPTTTMAIHWIEGVGEEALQGKWEVGKAGFGYGDNDDQTVLDQMQGNYRSIYIRQTYQVPADVPEGAQLTLDLRYDDGFVAYLDGKEVARQGVVGSGRAVQEVKSHEAEVWERFPLGPAVAGAKGWIAIEGHNDKVDSSDFTLRPRVDVRWDDQVKPVIKEGAEWAYLAGGIPAEGWAGPAGGKDASVPPYRLAYRPVRRAQGEAEGAQGWIRPEVSARPFGPTEDVVHSVDLAGLKPGTRYEFMIARYRTELGPWYFETAPDGFKAGMRFVTGGDMFHTRVLLDAMNKRAGMEDPLFALLGGDLAYANGVSGKRWREWVESWHRNAVAPAGRLIPMIAVIGNHEVKGAQFKPTNAPPRSDAPFFYSLFLGQEQGARTAIDFGNYLSILGLDSGHTQNVGSQTRWLDYQLEKRRKVPRLFVCYHRPAWGTGVKGDAVDIRREWSPLFERYLVDAVFENDHHVYKRTHPIRGGKVDPRRGVVYLGDGSWGVSTRAIPADWKTARPFLAVAESTNHLIRVTMGTEGFRYEAVKADGKVFDRSVRPLRR